MKRIGILILSIILVVATFTSCNSSSPPGEGQIVNVYSARHYDSDRDLFRRFEEQTGIIVNVLEGSSQELLARVNQEKTNPQADLFIDVGVTTLYEFIQSDLLQNHNLEVSSHLDEGMAGEKWLALTNRARAIVFDHQVTDNLSISSYLDLANPEFYNEILVRSSTNIYNIALVAALIQSYGEESAREFSEGVVRNMAREPQGNDRDQAIAMVAGEGRYTIMSTYYIQMLKVSSDTQQAYVGPRLSVAFPDETFVDISWMGVIQRATNSDNAVKLMEFLLTTEAQNDFMMLNGELPVNNNSPIAEELSILYDFNRLLIDYELLGRYMGRAIMIMNEAGWR